MEKAEEAYDARLDAAIWSKDGEDEDLRAVSIHP